MIYSFQIYLIVTFDKKNSVDTGARIWRISIKKFMYEKSILTFHKTNLFDKQNV
jgi:uncharacterized protein (DUF2249 family)